MFIFALGILLDAINFSSCFLAPFRVFFLIPTRKLWVVIILAETNNGMDVNYKFQSWHVSDPKHQDGW